MARELPRPFQGRSDGSILIVDVIEDDADAAGDVGQPTRAVDMKSGIVYRCRKDIAAE
jgi:hypothetical protein